MTAAPDAPPPPSAPRRRRRRWIIGAVVLVVLAWLGWAAVSLLGAADHARTGVDEVQKVQGLAGGTTSALLDSTTSTAATSGEAAKHLRAAAAEFDAAHDKVSGPLMAPLRLVPVIGRQVRSVQTLSEAAGTVASSSATAYDRITAVLGTSGADPAARTRAVAVVAEALSTLQSDVHGLGLGPVSGLVSPLASARDRFADQLGGLRRALAQAVPAARGTSAFLKGPSNYLVLAGNNAEMRAGSAMFLQAAPMDVHDGTFTVGDFVATEDLFLPAPGTTLDPDVEHNWGFLQPDQEFRNVNLTPRFDQSARMAADMWAASGRASVQGVLAVDVRALKRLLDVLGPVPVPASGGFPATTVSADTIEHALYYEQYAGGGTDNQARRERLGVVAASVLEAFNSSSVTAADLLRVFTDAGDGRNLLLWSSEPAQEAGWRAAGVDGSVRAGDIGVWLVNRGGDKLDPYLDVAVGLGRAPTATTGQSRYRLAVDLNNTAPANLPPYVGGPHANSRLPAGTWQGFLQFTVPPEASGFRTDGVPVETALQAEGPDGASRVVAVWVEVPRGATKAVSLEFDLPPERAEVTVLPSARPKAETWTAGGDQWADRRPVTVDLGAV